MLSFRQALWRKFVLRGLFPLGYAIVVIATDYLAGRLYIRGKVYESDRVRRDDALTDKVMAMIRTEFAANPADPERLMPLIQDAIRHPNKYAASKEGETINDMRVKAVLTALACGGYLVAREQPTTKNDELHQQPRP